MARAIFLWDDENVPHLAAHGLIPEEVEPVVGNNKNETVRSRASHRNLTFGMTRTSRFIAVAWEEHAADPWTVSGHYRLRHPETQAEVKRMAIDSAKPAVDDPIMAAILEEFGDRAFNPVNYPPTAPGMGRSSTGWSWS